MCMYLIKEGQPRHEDEWPEKYLCDINWKWLSLSVQAILALACELRAIEVSADSSFLVQIMYFLGHILE